jgi:hypothetical protein
MRSGSAPMVRPLPARPAPPAGSQTPETHPLARWGAVPGRAALGGAAVLPRRAGKGGG